MIKNLLKVASKSNIKPELKSVAITKEHFVATDSFKLVAIRHDLKDIKDTLLIKSEVIKKLGKVYTIENGRLQDGFLDYEIPRDEYYPNIYPLFDKEKDTRASIVVNRKYLIDLLQAIPDDDKFSMVELKITENFLFVKNKKSTGILAKITN